MEPPVILGHGYPKKILILEVSYVLIATSIKQDTRMFNAAFKPYRSVSKKTV